MHILIDGYNLLKAMPECRTLEALDAERARSQFIALLGRYRWLRGHQVTVVFDGWLGGLPLPRRLSSGGIHVIYSQRGEQADEVIRRLGPQIAHQGIVVSSDRALARHLAHLGVEVISSVAFRDRIRAALQAEPPDEPDDAIDMPPAHPPGPRRRLSRAERRRQRRLGNL